MNRTENTLDKKSRTIDRVTEFRCQSGTTIFNIDSKRIIYTPQKSEVPALNISFCGECFEDYIRGHLVNRLNVNPTLADVILSSAYAGFYGFVNESKDLKINYIIEANRDFVRRN